MYLRDKDILLRKNCKRMPLIISLWKKKKIKKKIQYKLHVYIFIVLIKNCYIYQLFFADLLILRNIHSEKWVKLKNRL